MQSYEKTSETQKKNAFFFAFPSASNFGGAKVTKKGCNEEAFFEY